MREPTGKDKLKKLIVFNTLESRQLMESMLSDEAAVTGKTASSLIEEHILGDLLPRKEHGREYIRLTEYDRRFRGLKKNAEESTEVSVQDAYLPYQAGGHHTGSGGGVGMNYSNRATAPVGFLLSAYKLFHSLERNTFIYAFMQMLILSDSRATCERITFIYVRKTPVFHTNWSKDLGS